MPTVDRVTLLLTSVLEIVIRRLLGRPLLPYHRSQEEEEKEIQLEKFESMWAATIVFSVKKTQLKWSSATDAECSICLMEFADGDVLQVLSACNHAFHTQCIDDWLIKNDTCPYCRCWRYEDFFGNEWIQ